MTVPLADALGGGWRPGLAVWAIPVAVAALAWLPALVRRDRAGRSAPAHGGPVRRAAEPVAHTARTLLRQPLAWQVTLFFALQSGGFYATLAWLPSIFRSHGASEAHAGLLLSLTMVVGLLTALTLPGLAGRWRDQRPLVIGCCALTAAGLIGILLAPMSAPYLWTVLLGLGQNASFPLALMLIVLRGGSVATTEGLSTLAQSVGYVLAAMAPLAVGALHGMAQSWTPALILLLALVVPQLLIGLAAGRDRAMHDGDRRAGRLTRRPGGSRDSQATEPRRSVMDTYVILRRSGWRSPEELGQAAERSTAEGDKMPDDVRWIRSYVLDEGSGSVGTVCIYQASSPEAIRAHAERGRTAGGRDRQGRRHRRRPRGSTAGGELTRTRARGAVRKTASRRLSRGRGRTTSRRLSRGRAQTASRRRLSRCDLRCWRPCSACTSSRISPSRSRTSSPTSASRRTWGLCSAPRSSG